MSARDVAQKTLNATAFGECNVVLFEDDQTALELFPLAVLRPAWDIFCGMGTLRQWVANEHGLLLRPRAELGGWVAHQNSEPEFAWAEGRDVLFVNGRLIACYATPENGSGQLPRTVTDEQGTVLLARRTAGEAGRLLKHSGTELAGALVQDSERVALPLSGWNIMVARYVWDYMRQNRELMERQLATTGKTVQELCGAHVMRELPSGVQMTDKMTGHPIYVGTGAKLMPGLVLGNHTGPLWIGPGVEVEPHCFLEGPLYIGQGSRVKAGTRLYHGCTLGPVCRVAGEISESIFQGFVNKQHDGFVGNSHLGSWVNLGADTVTSNLRNDYGTNKVQVGTRRVDSGQRYLGLMCGDHTKTGINTMLNTATVVGIGANVYGADYPPKYIESFMWGGAAGLKMGDLQRTLETARYAMARRGIELSVAEAELIAWHFAERVTNRKDMS